MNTEAIRIVKDEGCRMADRLYLLNSGVQFPAARYFVLGSALSFLTGRKPGSLPEDIIAEMFLPFMVLSLWVMSYSPELSWNHGFSPQGWAKIMVDDG